MSPDEVAQRRRMPRDWYWFLGRLGQTLIAIGLLMFLFVGYQLWGTGIEESQAQNRLRDRFDELSMPSKPPGNESTVVPDSSSVPGSTSGPSTTEWKQIVVEEGDPIASIEIPSIGVAKYVVAGVAPDDLKKGPGHYPSSPQPGHLGNMAIAGHRTTYGEPFRRLDQLSIGSDVVVTDVRGRRFFYVVDGQQVVGPDDSWVVATADPGRATLTLTTCHPAFSARQRLVVTASLDTARSPVVDDQPFVYASVAEANDALDLAPATTAVATASGSTPTAAAPSAADFVDESSDAFARGWFSDPHAWPQVVLWTLLESLVVGAGWWIARRARRRWHGAVAVALPFFFVLYFVFQNVNRLLPPNL